MNFMLARSFPIPSLSVGQELVDRLSHVLESLAQDILVHAGGEADEAPYVEEIAGHHESTVFLAEQGGERLGVDARRQLHHADRAAARLHPVQVAPLLDPLPDDLEVP